MIKYIILAMMLTSCAPKIVEKVVKVPVEVQVVVEKTCEVEAPKMISIAPPTSSNRLVLTNQCIAENQAYKQYVKELNAVISKCIKFK